MRVFLIVGLFVAAGCSAKAIDASPALPSDVSGAARVLAAAHEHGETHNYSSMSDRIELLREGELVSYCAEVAAPAAALLRVSGFDVRRVGLVALTPDPDGTILGHHLLEVYDPEVSDWVSVDIDYGVRFDQRATSLPDGRIDVTPLERDHLDTEWEYGYPWVADAVGIMFEGAYRYDPQVYTAAEAAILDGQGWQPIDDFTATFYG